MVISELRKKVREKLDGLVEEGHLKQVIDQTIEFNLLEKVVANYPVAFVVSPSFTSELLDTGNNLRTYTFPIVVILRGTEVDGYIVDELKEVISDAFDKDYTLGGVANGGITPAASPSSVENHNSKSYIVFVVTISARVTVQV